MLMYAELINATMAKSKWRVRKAEIEAVLKGGRETKI